VHWQLPRKHVAELAEQGDQQNPDLAGDDPGDEHSRRSPQCVADHCGE
jgi:hypothetical protein